MMPENIFLGVLMHAVVTIEPKRKMAYWSLYHVIHPITTLLL